MVLQRLLLLALVARAYTGPVSYTSETCANTCEENGHNFELGKTYDYDLLTTVTTAIPGATEEQSSLQLTAVAHIDVLSPCELALRLRDVVLQEGGTTVDRLSEMKTGLEGNTLRFALGGGLVTGLCPEASEQTWSLNIKRAILSSLQNSMPDFHVAHSTTETDVIGVCPVVYEPVATTENGFTVKKTKDMSSCSQPSQANTMFQTMSHSTPSKVKSLPLLKSTHSCEQELSSEKTFIVKSVCKEYHVFRPFSRGDSGATTTVVQSLSLKSQSRMTVTRNQPVNLRTDLQYEHVANSSAQENAQREIVSTMQKICEVTQEGVRPEVPGLFLDLVKGMRQADLNTLVSIGRQAKRLCSKAESLYHDAVPTLGTPAGVGLMRNMIRGGEVTKEESDMWLSSLAFIPKPNLQMLREVKPLLTMESVRRKAYLAVSSLIHTYCTQNANCENDVQEIISIFRNNLGSDCSGDHNVILMSLKALGNTGLTSRSTNVLNNCVMNEALSMEARVAAINSMRRMNCNVDKNGLTQLLQSTFADAELRINSYLVLMQCPTEELITKVKQILEKEEINQVGSFIWTHLTNLMESSSPLKKNVQTILENAQLKKAFDLDKRKYSRNIEWSAFSEAVNAGVAVESNLIWSSQSFVPRAGMVNLTIDLFGQSVNLMEMGGRMQGLDSILENMFGDKKEGSAMTNDVIGNFDSTYKVPKTDPKGSYYIRIFGNEIKYDDFVGFELEGIKDKLNYLQWLIELAKEHNIDYTKSMLFLESDLKIPTVAGMPLVLSVDGSATMDLKIKGKLDLRSLLSSPSEIDIIGSVRPSAAVEINSKMGVDAFVAKTGLKMSNTFHTSTLADGVVQLKEGKIFNLDINMPQERMDIFNAESKFYITYRGNDVEQQMEPEDRTEVHRCFAGSLVRALGVELCADVSVPSLTKITGPWFPLNGPVRAALSLHKKDSFTKYHMEARVVKDVISPDVTNHEVVFAFNTPGSIYDREFLVNFVLNRQENKVKMDLRTPWKKFGLTGNVINEDTLKQMTGQISIDDVIQYSLLAKIQMNQGRYAMRFIPKVELVLPGRAPLKLSGSATYREDKKLDVDISIENVLKDPAVFKGLVRKIKEDKKIRIESDLEVRVNSFKGQMSGFFDHLRTKDEIKTDTEVTVRYRTDNGPQFFSVGNQFHFENPKGRKALLLAGTVSSSLYAKLDSDFSLNMVTEGNEALMSLNMGLTNDKPKRITADLQGKVEMTRQLRSAAIQGQAKINVIGTEIEASLDHKHNPNELQTFCNGRIGSQKGTFNVNLRRQSIRPLNAVGNVKITYLDHEITYSQSLIQQGNVYSHEMNVAFDERQLLALSSTLKTGQLYEVSTDLNLALLDAIHVEGQIKPDMSNFLTKAKCVYGIKSFSADLQWQHEGTIRQFGNKAVLNVDLDGDKYGLVSDVSLDNTRTIKVNVESRMEVQNQDIKKIAVSGMCVMSIRMPSVKARVQWWPNNFIDGQIDAKLDGNGLSSPERELEGSFSLKSSFYEDVSAIIKHSRSPGKVNTEGEVTWAPDRKTDFTFGLLKDDTWSDVNVKLLINSPFRRFHRVNSNIAYQLNRNQFSSNGQLGLNDKLVTYEFTGAASWKNSAVELKATTPFEQYEKIAIVIKNSHSGQVYASMVKLDINSDEKFGLDFNMEHEGRGYFIKNTGSLALNLPIVKYQTNKLTWSHENNARNFNSRIVIEARNEKLVFDFELKNRKVFSIKTKLLTPFIQDIYVSLDHQSDRREYVYKTSASVQHGDDEMKLENDLSLLSTSQMLKTMLKTPFTGYEDLILDISSSRQERTHEGQFKLLMNEAEYSITGTFINNGLPALTLEILGKCPHSPDASLRIVNEKQGNIWESKMNAQYQQDKSVALIATLGLNDLKKLSVDISSPFSFMEKASLDLEHYGSPRQFQSKMKLSHNMLTDDVDIAALLDVIDLNDAKLEVTGRSPLQWLRTGKAVVRHRFNGEVYQTDSILEYTGTQLSASNTLQLTNARLFSNRMQLKYGNKKMDSELQVNAEDGVSVSYKQQSTLCGEQTAILKHQGDWKNLKTSLSLSLNPSKVFSSEATFFLKGNDLDASLQIATPVEKLQLFEMVANHHGAINNFENAIKVNYNSELLVARIRSDISSYKDMKIEVTGETPWIAVKNIFGEIKHKHIQQTHQTDFSFTSPTMDLGMSHVLEISSKKVFTSKAMMKFQEDTMVETELKVDLADDISISAALRSPWTGEQKASVMHKGTWKQFEATVTVNPSQSENVISHVQFTLAGDRLNTLARITTTYQQLRNFELAVSHLGSLRSFETEMKVDLNGRSQNAKIIAITRMNDINLKLTATTPIAEFETTEVAFTHKYGQGIGQTNFKGQLGSRTFTASNMLEITNSKTFNNKAVVAYLEETIMQLEVNLNAMRNIDFSTVFRSKWTGVQMASLVHQGGFRDFETTVKVSPMHGQTLVYYLQATITDNSFNGRSKLTTPYSHLEMAEVTLSHQGRIEEFVSNVMIKYNKKQLDGQLSVNIDNINDIKIEVSGATPFAGFEKVVAKLLHRFDGRQCQSDITFETTSVKTSASNIIQKNSAKNFVVKTAASWMNKGVIASELSVNVESNAAVEAKLQTSWTGKQSFTFIHNGNLENFDISLDVSPRESQHIAAQMQFSLSGTKVNGNLKITTPYAGVESFEVALKHQGRITKFTSEVTASLNSHMMRTELVFDVRDVNDMALKVEVILPVDRFENNNLLFQNKVNGQTHQTDLTSDIGQYKVEASNTLQIRSGSTFSTKARVLFQEESVAGLEVDVDVTSNIGFNAKFVSQWTGEHFVTLSHQGGWRNFETAVIIGITQANLITFDAKSSLQSQQYNGFAQLTTPFSEIKMLKVSVNHNGKIQSFTNQLEVVLNENVLDSQLAVNFLKLDDFNMKWVAKTPFTGFEDINGSIQHKFSGRTCNSEMIFEAPKSKMALSNALEIRSKQSFNNKASIRVLQNTMDVDVDVDIRRNIALSGKLESTWTGTQTASMTHQGTWRDFQTSINISPRQSDNIIADTQFSLSRNQLRSSVKITTPYRSLSVFESRINHQGSVKKFDTECFLIFNSHSNSLNLGGDFRNINEMSMKISALTAIEDFSRNELIFNHRFADNVFQSDLQMKFEEETFIASNVLQLSSYKSFIVDTDVKHGDETVAGFQLNVDSVRKVDTLLRTKWSGKQTASLSHEGHWRNFETNIDISPNDGDHIILGVKSTLQGYTYDGLIKITTPYDELSDLEVAVKHNGHVKKFDDEISVSFNRMVFQGKATVDVTNVNDMHIKVTGNTPFRGFKVLDGLFQHQFTGRICKTELVLEAPTGKVAASNMIQIRSKSSFNTKTSLNMMEDKMADLELDVDVEKSISLRGKFASSWTGVQGASLTHQGAMNNFQTEVNISPQEQEVVTLNFQVSQQNENLSGLVKITSPYSILKNLDVTMVHQGMFRKFSNNVVINFNEDKIESELSADLTNLRDVNVQLTGQTSFEGLQTINGHFIHKLGKQQCQTQFQFETPMKKVALSHVMKFERKSFSSKSLFNLNGQKTDMTLLIDNSDIFSINASLSSPCTGEKNVSIVSQGTWRNFETYVAVSPRKSEVVDVKAKFSAHSDIDASLKISSTYSDWDLSLFDFRHTGSVWKFGNELDVEYKQKSGSMRISVDFSDCQNLHASISSELPFYGLEKINFDFKHMQTATEYNSGIELQMYENAVKASNLVRMDGSQGMSTEMSLECSFMDKVAVSMDIDLKDSITATAEFTSPWTGKRMMNLAHQGKIENFQTKFSLTSPTSQTLKFNAQFSLEANSVNGKVSFESAFSTIRLIEVALTHEGDVFSFENQLTVKYNNAYGEAKSRFSLDTTGVEGKFEMETPFTHLEQLSFTMSHKGDLISFNSKYELEYKGRKTVFTGVYDFKNTEISGKFDLRSPYREVRSAGLQFTHKGDVRDFQNNGAVYMNDQQYTAESAFTSRDNSVHFTAKIQLHHDYSMELYHNGALANFANNVTLRMDEEVIMVQSNFQMNDGNIKTSVAVKTPFASLRNANLIYTHKGNLMDFECNMNARINDQEMMGKHIWKLTEKVLLHSLIVNTPFEGYSELKYNMGHQEKRGMMKQNLLLSIEGDKFEVKAAFKKTTNKISGNINVHTPFSAAKKMSLIMMHKMVDTFNFNTDISTSLNSHTITISGSCSKKNNMVEASVDIATPFQGASRVKGLFKHTGPLNSFSNELNLSIDDTVMSAGTSFRFQNEAISADISIETPFRTARMLNLRMSHYGTGINFRNNMTGTYNDHIVNSAVSMSVQNGEIKTSLRLQTPFKGYRNLASGIHLRKESSSFNSEFSIEMGRKKGILHQRLILRDVQSEGSIILETPYQGYRNMGLKFKHVGSVRNFNAEFTGYRNSQKIQIKTSFKFHGSKVDLKLMIETPFTSFSKAGVIVKHDGYLRDFYNVISLNFKEKFIEHTGVFSIRGQNINANFTLNTPFEVARLLKFQMSHSGTIKKFENMMTATYNKYDIRSNGQFALLPNSIEANFQVQTPFVGYTTLAMSVMHRGKWIPSRSKYVINLEDDRISLTHDITSDDSKQDASMLVETTYPFFNKIGFTTSHSGHAMDFMNEFKLFTGSDAVVGDCKFALKKATVNFETNLKTPIPGFNEMGINFKQNGISWNFNNELNIFLENNAITSINSMEVAGHNVAIDFKIETPFQKFSTSGIVIKHQGDLTDFNNELNIHIGQDAVSGVNSFKLTRQAISADFKLETTFAGFSTMGFTLKHRGPATNFNNQVKIYLENKAITGVNKFEFGGQSVSGDFTLVTPFTGYSIMGINLKHEGLLKKFSNEIKFYVESKAIVNSNTFEIGGQALSADIKVETPFRRFTSMGAVVRHQGQPRSFNNEVKVYLENNFVTSTNNFGIENEIVSADFKVETSFDGFSTLGMTAKHEGLARSFKNELKIFVEEKAITSMNDLEINGRTISANFQLQTPFEIYSSAGVAIKHRGLLRNFNNEVKMYIEENVVNTWSSFQVEGRSLTADFKAETTFASAKLLAFKLTHSGHLKNFKNHLMTTYNDYKFENRNSFVLYRQKMVASIELETPFIGYQNLGFSFKRVGLASDFTIEVLAKKEDLTIDGKCTSKFTSSSYMMTGSMESPFGDVITKINHEGSLTNFKSEASLKINSHQYDVNMEAQTSGDALTLSTILTMPEKYGIIFEHKGPWTGFNNKLHVIVADEPHIATSSFSYGEDIEANVNLESTNIPVTMSFKHGGQSWRNFKQESSLNVMGQTYQHNGEFMLQGRKVNGLFTLNTPHKQARSLSLKFSHQGRWTNFENQLALQLNEDTMTTNSQLTISAKRVKGGIYVRIPDEYSVEIIQKGPKTDLTAIIKVVTGNKKSQLNTDFKTTNGIVDGTLELRSAYLAGNIEASINYNRGQGTFTSSLRTPFEKFEHMSAEISHQGKLSDFTTTVKLITPATQFQDIAFEFNHKGNCFDLVQSGYMDVDGKRVSGDVTFVKTRQNMEATVNIKTPFSNIETGHAKLSHRGPLRDFKTNAVIQWNNKKVEGAIDFKKARTIEGNVVLTTPFAAIRQAALSLNYQGTMQDFVMSSDASLNGQKITGVVNFVKRGTVLESTGTLTTPFSQLKDGSYKINHRGYLSDFATSGEIKFDKEVIEGEIVHKLAPEIMTTMRLSTPWNSLKQAKINLNHRGHLLDFSTIFSGQLNGQVIDSNLGFMMTASKVKSSAAIKTPYEQFKEFAYTYTHDIQPQDFKATATLTLPLKVFKNFRGEFGLSGTSDDLKGTLKVNTPFDALPESVIVVTHTGDMKAFTTACSFVAASRNIEGKMTLQRNRKLHLATLKISTPYRKLKDFYFEIKNEKKGSEMTTLIEATYNGEKHFDTDFTINTGDLTYATLNIHAPVNIEIRGRNKKRTKEMIFNIPSVLYLTTSYLKEKGKFTQATQFQLGNDARNKFSYTIEGTKAITNQQVSYGGKLNLESRHGSFKSGLEHVINHRKQQYITDLMIQRLKLNSDITLQKSLKSIFKITHPSLNKDLVIGVEGSMIDAYQCKLNLDYDGQNFEFTGKLADESPSHGNTKYIAEAHLTHPGSHLDVQFTSKLMNNIEKMGGDMEVKYMMTKDRQLRSNALRAEINKIKEELNLEVDTPVKHLSMRGRRLNAGNGRHLAVSGTVDDRDLSADIQLHSGAPGFDVSLQLDSENKILVSGKYEEPSSLLLQAFREESGHRIRESEMSVTLNSDNILSAKFFMNPNFYADMKRLFGVDFGLEKMVNDVLKSLRQEFRSKEVHLTRALQPLKSAWEEITTPVISLAAELYDGNDYYIRDVVDRVSYWTMLINDRLAMLKYKYSQHFTRKLNEVKALYSSTTGKLLDFMESKVAPFAASVYVKVMETLDYIHSHPMLEKAWDWMLSLDIERHYNNFKYYVVDTIVKYNAILDRIDNFWEKLNNIPGMSFFVRSVRGYINAVRWVYDVTELDRLVQALMTELRVQGWQALVNWWHRNCRLVQPHVTRYAPEQGEYEVQMKMPVSFSQVSGVPDWPIFKHWDKVKRVVSKKWASFNRLNFSFANGWAFWVLFYAYKPSSSPLDWIPPFKSHATVAGSQHFMTFDKKFYEYVGDCSYLLARDFIDGKFSVLINYDNVNGVMSKKSVTVHSGDKEIEILSNYKVKVDGRESDLPIKSKQTVIRRIGNIIQLDNDHGLGITCDLANDRCTVKVTGWYYGKTGGLFGTYDNEPATDFHTADRHNIKSLEDFALTWSSGSRCRAVNSATKVEPSTSSAEYTVCAKYFEKQTSPYRICFGQVDPSPFMTMCMNDVSTSTDRKAAACKIASFYVEECNMAYVPMRLSKDCVTCQTPSGSVIQEGQTMTLMGAEVPKAADVVFVMSHKSCNRDVTRKIGNIAQQITRSFSQSGISDVRFGLVGYGLPGVLNEPHTHTIDGDIFNTADKIRTVMDNFPITNEQTNEDSLAAINFASQYPFRAGASKSVILVPCDSCQEDLLTYPEIQQVLQYHNIRLHLLMDHTFQLRTTATKTAYIFGIDEIGLFTPRSLNDKELTGDRALRRQVMVPKDLCAALSQESNGAIFSVTQLMQSRTVVQKKFTDVFSRLVAKKGTPTSCQICDCVADASGVGVTQCKSCSTTVKSWVEEQENEEPVQAKKKKTRSIRQPRRKNKQRRKS